MEAAPEEERLVGGGAAFYRRNRALSRPPGVVERLRQIPGMFAFGRAGLFSWERRRLACIGGPCLEEILPVGQAVLFHPNAVMLSRMGLIGVIARHLYMLKAIPRPVEITPERQVAQDRLALERRLLRARGQRLKMGLADEGRVIAVPVQHIANGRHILTQLHANRSNSHARPDTGP